jgi:hypothetical protein
MNNEEHIAELEAEVERLKVLATGHGFNSERKTERG